MRSPALRKERGLTQQTLVSTIAVHVTQLRRCEGGTSQPALAVLRKLAVALSVIADLLFFDKDEHGHDEELKLQVKAIEWVDPEEKRVIKEIVGNMLIKYDGKRWMAMPRSGGEGSAVSASPLAARPPAWPAC